MCNHQPDQEIEHYQSLKGLSQLPLPQETDLYINREAKDKKFKSKVLNIY